MSHTAETSVRKCPGCNDPNIEKEAYEFAGLCSNCGLVITETGEPSIPESVSSDTKDTLTQEDSFREICKVTNDTENRLKDAFGTIEDIAEQLPIPTETRISAADIYLEAFREGCTDGRERTCFVTACVRIASVNTSTAIPSATLIETFDEVTADEFHRNCRLIPSETDIILGVPAPADYVWFLEETDVASAIDTLRQVLESATEKDELVGKDPAGIAAAGVYVVEGSVTQATAADAMGVSTETIRRRSKVLREVVSDD